MLFWMLFYRSFQKASSLLDFGGMSLSSWRYEELSAAGFAVSELNLLWQTVWA